MALTDLLNDPNKLAMLTQAIATPNSLGQHAVQALQSMQANKQQQIENAQKQQQFDMLKQQFGNQQTQFGQQQQQYQQEQQAGGALDQYLKTLPPGAKADPTQLQSILASMHGSGHPEQLAQLIMAQSNPQFLLDMQNKVLTNANQQVSLQQKEKDLAQPTTQETNYQKSIAALDNTQAALDNYKKVVFGTDPTSGLGDGGTPGTGTPWDFAGWHSSEDIAKANAAHAMLLVASKKGDEVGSSLTGTELHLENSQVPRPTDLAGSKMGEAAHLAALAQKQIAIDNAKRVLNKQFGKPINTGVRGITTVGVDQIK